MAERPSCPVATPTDVGLAIGRADDDPSIDDVRAGGRMMRPWSRMSIGIRLLALLAFSAGQVD